MRAKLIARIDYWMEVVNGDIELDAAIACFQVSGIVDAGQALGLLTLDEFAEYHDKIKRSMEKWQTQ